jgi:hypothetical protein
LQELLAPRTVIFYDKAWQEIGTKTWMEQVISSITGISCEHLRQFTKACIAQRMSWAAQRDTTREEDGAYCLMGLFNVHMPTLYGEGHKAFLRLQLEILAASDDESLFAWTASSFIRNSSIRISPLENLGLLAESPSWFAYSGNIVRTRFDDHRPPFLMTNKGIRLEVFATKSLPGVEGEVLWVPLNCGPAISAGETHLVLQLHERLDDGNMEYYPGAWRRARDFTQQTTKGLSRGLSSERLVIFVKQSDFHYVGRPGRDPFTGGTFNFSIKTESLLKHGFDFIQRWTPHWESMDGRTKDFEKTNVTLVINSGFTDWYCLKFKSAVELASDTDSFVILLEEDPNFKGIPLLGITIPNDGDTSLPKPTINRKSLDRASKRMKSGRSVSVALRRRPGNWRNPLYVVDVTIDPEGNLPWPDLS